MALTYSAKMKEVRAMIFGLDKQSIEDLFSYLSSAVDLHVAPLLLPTLAMEQRLLQYRDDIINVIREIYAVEKSIGMRRYVLQGRDGDSETPKLWKDADLIGLATTVNTIISSIVFVSLHLENGSAFLEFLTEMTESIKTKAISMDTQVSLQAKQALVQAISIRKLSVRGDSQSCPWSVPVS
jgi:hypothetical protein